MIADDMEKQPLIGMQGCIIFKIEESREEMGDIEKRNTLERCTCTFSIPKPLIDISYAKAL